MQVSIKVPAGGGLRLARPTQSSADILPPLPPLPSSPHLFLPNLTPPLVKPHVLLKADSLTARLGRRTKKSGNTRPRAL